MPKHTKAEKKKNRLARVGARSIRDKSIRDKKKAKKKNKKGK